MGKKKPLPLLNDITFTAIGAEGKALARVDDMVLFVPMLIPGDVADIRVRRKRKRYMEGDVIALKEPSADRIAPRCRHFGVCGGCKWQHMPYELQLRWKAQQVFDNLNRIGRVGLTTLPDIIPAPDPFRYRNKLEYTFSARRWLTREEIDTGEKFDGPGALGFHIPGYFDKVLDITECHLQSEPSDSLRNRVREYAVERGLTFYDQVTHEGFLRNLIVRTTPAGEVMVILVTGYENKEEREPLLVFMAKEYPQITSLWWCVNEKFNDSLSDRAFLLWSGSEHLTEVMGSLKFRVGPKSFFQTNSRQAVALYETALEFAGLTGGETVYDLYCGAGTITCFLADKAGKVTGIEYVEETVADARVNASVNNIENVSFVAGDMKDVLTDSFFRTHGSPDVIVTDPPRAGMHPGVVERIVEAAPAVVVYVSCNPATQARDIALMAGEYEVTGVRAVDMFPQTHHIETVVQLKRRS
jgi:23S rRNA (uracil1939-C5)-methyltransferase